MAPPFYLGVLDSILVPIVALNGAAMAAIAAIAYGTGKRRVGSLDRSPEAIASAAARDAAVISEAVAEAGTQAGTQAEAEAKDEDDDRTQAEKNGEGADRVPFPRFLVNVDRKDGSCAAFADSKTPHRQRGALYVGKAIAAAEKGKEELLRRAALDLAYAAADAVRRNCAGTFVPLHPAPGPWLALADLSVPTVFGVRLHVYCRLTRIAEAVEGAIAGPCLSVTIDASAPSCVDPSTASGEARRTLTEFAATCAARLLATVAGDEHDGSLIDDPVAFVRSDHASLYRFESSHEVRRISRLVGVPGGGGEEVVVARAAVLALASLRSLKHIAVVDGIAFVPLPSLSQKTEKDLDDALDAAIKHLEAAIGPAATTRLLERDRTPEIVVPLQPGHPWVAGFVGRRPNDEDEDEDDDAERKWFKYDAARHEWDDEEPIESPLKKPSQQRDPPGLSINDYFLKDIINKRVDVIDDKNAIVYVLGDLEGQDDVLFSFLSEKKLINVDPVRNSIAWNSTGENSNVYVVQCGDQIDSKRLETSNTRTIPANDLHVLLLTDYLSHISNGKFISLIGNHEVQNMVGDFYCVHPDHVDANRITLFSFDGLMGKIVRSRNVLLRINDALFSHAGVCKETAEGLMKDYGNLDDAIAKVHGMLDYKANFGCDHEKTDKTSPGWIKYVYDAHGLEKKYDENTGVETRNESNTSVLCTRKLYPGNYSPDNEQPIANPEPFIVPKSLHGRIRVQITGHNKSEDEGSSMEWIKQDNDAQSTFDTCIVTKSDKTKCDENTFTIDAGHTAMVMTDTVDRTLSNNYDLRYLQITWTPADVKLVFGKFSCQSGTCPIIKLSGILGKSVSFDEPVDLWIDNEYENSIRTKIAECMSVDTVSTIAEKIVEFVGKDVEDDPGFEHFYMPYSSSFKKLVYKKDDAEIDAVGEKDEIIAKMVEFITVIVMEYVESVNTYNKTFAYDVSKNDLENAMEFKTSVIAIIEKSIHAFCNNLGITDTLKGLTALLDDLIDIQKHFKIKYSGTYDTALNALPKEKRST